MGEKNISIIPNTTQIPHLIIREWMPRLSDVELRVLLVVADQTLGWVEDATTGRRKEKDWISQFQLMTKINRSDRAVQKALHRLVDELAIIQAHDELGNLLNSSQKRMKCGGKIFYRLSLRAPQPELFSRTPEKGSGVKKFQPARKNFSQPPKNLRAKNLRATKETGSTEINKSYRTSELISNLNKKSGETVDNKPAPTRYFLWKFGQLSEAIRHTKPSFVKFKDGKLITHALRHLNEFQLELELIWFLENKPQMRASIGAALCREVIRDFIKASYREYGFYGNLERIALQYGNARGPKDKNEAEKMSAMVEALNRLKESLGVPWSKQEREQITESL